MAGLDLTDARAREPDLAADGLERLRLAAGETEAPAQHLTLVLREVVEDRPPTDAEGKWIRFRSGACYKRQGAREIVRLLAAAIVSAVVLASGHPAAWAQASATLGTAGLYLIPSFKVSESFDDNILASSSNRESDFISRFYPGLQGGYSSDPFTLLLSGGFEADVFAKHPELNDPTTGWNAAMNLSYLPIRRLTLGANIAYIETKSLPTPTHTVTNLTLANPLFTASTVPQGRPRPTLTNAASSVAYVHSEGFVVGQGGPTTTDTFSSSIAFSPSRSLLVSVGTTTSKFSGGTSSSTTSISSTATSSTSSTTTYGATAGATYQIFRWLTARTSYSFSYQEQSTGNIPHNVVLLGLDISYPS